MRMKSLSTHFCQSHKFVLHEGPPLRGALLGMPHVRPHVCTYATQILVELAV